MPDYHSFSEIRKSLRNQEISVPMLVEGYLSNINDRKNLNAFIEIFDNEAREKAKIIQDKIDHGSHGKLAGLVLGLKDNLSYQDHGLSAGSKIIEDYVSPYNGTAIQKLIDEDAIIIGRLNCDEFGMGGSNENSAFGPCLNPIDESKVAGGSSGGSACAVAADTCHAALGSDTGGSVRQPASFCGIVGLKPTYGQISRHGLIAYASSFDQIGPMTKSVEDAELLFNAMSTGCEFDATIVNRKRTTESEDFNFAILEESFEDQTQNEIKDSLRNLELELKEKGHMVDRIRFPLIEYIVPTYYILTMAEASSNLARYDGIQYGKRFSESNDIIELVKESRSMGFGKEVKRRLMMGNFVLSQEFAEAYFNKAQKVRNQIRTATNEILKKYDFIVTPTAPSSAFKVGEKNKDPLTLYLMDIFTVQANLTGNPAITLPLYKDDDEMPFGIQFLSAAYTEQKLFELGKYLYR